MKKIPGLLRSSTREKVIFIAIHINDYKLSNLCAALSISRRTYYKYRNQEDPDYFDYVLIKEIFDASKGTYGYRRIQEGLKQQYGVTYNHKKLQRIMNKYGLKPE
ncbi:MAG: transposase [Methanomicrobia archaeon]|nr:transposase [Methanomicrobia archaeon]